MFGEENKQGKNTDNYWSRTMGNNTKMCDGVVPINKVARDESHDILFVPTDLQ
jgi:hypothetical protein